MALNNYGLVQVTSKQGEVKTAITGLQSLLQFWALQNTPDHRTSIIFDMDGGDVVYIAKGTGAFPTVKVPPVGKYNVHSILPDDAYSALFNGKEAM